MTTATLVCGEAVTLFYESDGLLLRSCLIPIDGQHDEHLLTFQLGYLGIGDIVVHVALETGHEAPGLVGEATDLAVVELSGIDMIDEVDEVSRNQAPSVELTYVRVPDRQVRYQYTVWGQAGSPNDNLRGELSVVVCGRPPVLNVTVRAGATRKAIPEAGAAADSSKRRSDATTGNGLARCQARRGIDAVP